MKVLEKIFIVMAVIGLFLRVMMWDWGELFLTVSLPSLAVLYLLMSWTVFKHREHGHHLFLSFLSGASFSVVCFGILCKLMVWKLGNLLLIAGLSMMVLFKVIGMILERTRVSTMGKYFKMLFLRYYIKSSIALLMLFMPYKTIVSIYHRDDPDYVNLYIRWFDEPNNLKYRSDFFKYRRAIFKKERGIKEYKEHIHDTHDSSDVHID